ncbi:uncharacterized protein LOC134867086 isoform X2 [Eleginops maclovinus]|uniref:uncharacterized protein LOC134867086 isoform X2 n=1 Tax=Eleginops maclovinus TaxID=56733 RepID=UPI00307FF062
MDALRSETFFTHPVICYFLDGFLTLYCLFATALFFREKFSVLPLEAQEPGVDECIYQELDRAKETDAYDELETSKWRKKKAVKKVTSESTEVVPEQDAYQSLMASGSSAS